MGCSRSGPFNFHLVGRGPARPGPSNSQSMSRGPVHQFFMGRGPAQPITAHHFLTFTARPGPAHDIGGKPRSARYFRGPARGFGRPVDLMGQSVDMTGRPMCSPLFLQYVWFFCLFFVSASLGQLLLAHEVHEPTTHTVLLHQRPGPIVYVPTGGPPPLLLLSRRP